MAFAPHSSATPGAKVNFPETGKGTFGLPPGPSRQYRLAQADDYYGLPRARFPWQPPVTFNVRARASHVAIPGTWGFGLWNDPMSLSLGFGSARKFPALPNAVWYFFASSENALSLRDDLPSHGALAATFCAPNLPAWLLASGGLALPLLFFRPLARVLRRLTAKVVQQDAVALPLDPTKWHTYAFTWMRERVTFEVDGAQVLDTSISPRGPLGLVIWVDNQFAAWQPDGALQWGVLEGKTAYEIQIEDLNIT
ncbi:MAG: hypothetical protein H6636_06470 [Anaerolineales bacterium]|nr:hypothetical protein [Anaerolineales bacterium]